MAGGKARLTRPGEQASHKITFEAPDGKHYACTDKDGKVKYPAVKVQRLFMPHGSLIHITLRLWIRTAR